MKIRISPLLCINSKFKNTKETDYREMKTNFGCTVSRMRLELNISFY